jgi:hypothetical protein
MKLLAKLSATCRHWRKFEVRFPKPGDVNLGFFIINPFASDGFRQRRNLVGKLRERIQPRPYPCTSLWPSVTGVPRFYLLLQNLFDIRFDR